MLLDNFFFQIQYYMDKMSIDSINQNNVSSIILILITGILTGFNPCTLSIIPIYLNYIHKEDKSSKISILLFLGGIITSISSIGIISLIVGKSTTYGDIFTIIAGLITILLGLNYLNIIPNVKLPNEEIKHYLKYIKKFIKFTPYINGIIFGLTISSCSTPILVTISLWIIKSKNLIWGLFLMVIYSVGYSIPIILLSFTINNIENIIKKYISNESIYLVNGFILIALGTIYSLSIL
uniref:cytochrome c biogenesis protein transmembrane region n=1 Tax=Porphyridium aerugineum TaxID=2792 RepID=UPI001FCDBE72|nr:cytochrome c biogenesis protein transmembrane region [Porphyridium aerugineum]UNJ17974.1 cytochrome c biogenesis protein transmembrane region [Porphyridium aerugineum]